MVNNNSILNSKRQANGIPIFKQALSPNLLDEVLASWGLDQKTIDKFELGEEKAKGLDVGRLAIPFHDYNGHLLGTVTRSLVDRYPCAVCNEVVTGKELLEIWRKDGKNGIYNNDWKKCPHCNALPKAANVFWLVNQLKRYVVPKGVNTTDRIYNMHRALLQMARSHRSASFVIVEGYRDVWAADQAGYAAVSYNNSVPSESQLAVVARHINKVVISPSLDSAGVKHLPNTVKYLQDRAIEVYLCATLPAKRQDLSEVLTTGKTEAVAKVLRNQVLATPEAIKEIQARI